VPKYAMVVVVDAANEVAAFEERSAAVLNDEQLEFVGGPWQVEDRSGEDDYYTEALLAQMPASPHGRWMS
jgi:hypothetical protein